VVVLTIMAMSASGLVHPPAGAYSFLYVNRGMGWRGIFAPGRLGAGILVASNMAFEAGVKPLIVGRRRSLDILIDKIERLTAGSEWIADVRCTICYLSKGLMD